MYIVYICVSLPSVREFLSAFLVETNYFMKKGKQCKKIENFAKCLFLVKKEDVYNFLDLFKTIDLKFN